jgi:hypothetical protein
MSALLFIQARRREAERLELSLLIRTAMNADSKAYRKQMDQLARSAEIDLRWED